MRRLGHFLTLFYGKVIPYHRGRWRVISSMISFFGLRRPCRVLAKRRGVQFGLHLQDFLDVHLYYIGYYDYAETLFLEANLEPGNVFFDVGANLGYYSLHASRCMAPSGEVHAFEISSDEFSKLDKNISLNEFGTDIKLNRIAVSDKIGEVGISPTFAAGMSQLDLKGEYQYQTVPVTTLDHYIEESGISRVDFVKCDIEGAEYLMLEGAKRLFGDFRPLLLIEINPSALAQFDASIDDVLSKLTSQNYTLLVFGKTTFGIYLRLMEAGDLPTGSGYINAIAVPSERLYGNSGRLSLRLRDWPKLYRNGQKPESHTTNSVVRP